MKNQKFISQLSNTQKQQRKRTTKAILNYFPYYRPVNTNNSTTTSFRVYEYVLLKYSVAAQKLPLYRPVSVTLLGFTTPIMGIFFQIASFFFHLITSSPRLLLKAPRHLLRFSLSTRFFSPSVSPTEFVRIGNRCSIFLPAR